MIELLIPHPFLIYVLVKTVVHILQLVDVNN